MTETLQEYESQLSEVIEMLEADPNEESLLQLKKDLLLLISETKQSGQPQPEEAPAPHQGSSLTNKTTEHEIQEPPSTTEISAVGGEDGATPNQNENNSKISSSSTTTKSTTAAPQKKTKKSKKSNSVPSTFEIPTHLIPLDSDTEAERNRKRRAIKTLKSKWRERVKESTTTKKQKSWQDFVGKGQKKRKNGSKGSTWKGVANVGGSIFKTEDGVNARVGVIGSGKSMTEFGERKRFKM